MDIEYLKAKDIESLRDKAQGYINEGWEIMGNTTLNLFESDGMYIQRMIRSKSFAKRS